MAGRGLAKKEKCDTDRRGAYVLITRRGRSDIKAAAPGPLPAVRRLFVGRLTPSQLEAMHEAADIVLVAFDNPSEPDTATNHQEGQMMRTNQRESLRVIR